MAITKALMMSFANNQLTRSETDIDDQVSTILTDLNLYPLLEASDTTITVADEASSFAKPTGFKDNWVIAIILEDSGGTVLKPLKPFPGGYEGFRTARRGSSVVEGVPEFYACFADNIHIWPAAGDDYTGQIDYYKLHSVSTEAGEGVNNIEYGDEYANCFRFGAAYYTALRYNTTPQIAIWQPLYFAEIEKMRLGHPTQQIAW